MNDNHRIDWPDGGFWVTEDHTLPAPPDDRFISAYCVTCEKMVNVTLERGATMVVEKPWTKELNIKIGWHGFGKPKNGRFHWDYGGWESDTGRRNTLLNAWVSFGPMIQVTISRHR